jgi:hypothetical protein
MPRPDAIGGLSTKVGCQIKHHAAVQNNGIGLRGLKSGNFVANAFSPSPLQIRTGFLFVFATKSVLYNYIYMNLTLVFFDALQSIEPICSLNTKLSW